MQLIYPAQHMKILNTFVLLLILLSATAQENRSDMHPLEQFDLGALLFDHSLYIPARFHLQQFNQTQSLATEDDFDNIKNEAASMFSISGLRADLMSGENELIRFIHLRYPDPVTTPAILELGSYYFNKKWYQRCIDTYEMIDLDRLSESDKSEASLKKGYALFVNKEFIKAREELARTKDVKGEFYYPINYYYGMCEYFTGNYAGATSSFEKVKNEAMYTSFVPYYLVQIYAAQGENDKVIQYGEKALNDKQLRNRKEIRLIIGQTYFNQKQYDKALPHLEYYEANTEKLTFDEFYQLGYTQYQLKNYDKAIRNFKEISLTDSRSGQIVNHYLADCYNKTGDKLSARTAFKKVSQMNYEPDLRDEAIFNYVKLTAESGLEREAINTLVKIDAGNKYYTESQQLLGDLLENTMDYEAAIQIIENMHGINEKFKTIYQSLSLKYGIQLYNDDNKEKALAAFSKSYKYLSSRNTASQGMYWSALIHHENGATEQSGDMLKKYFETSSGITWLPDESTQAMAYYVQGYNHFKQKQYNDAESAFKQSVSLIKANVSKIKNKHITEEIWPDALIRTGDCLFTKRDYKNAKLFYNQAFDKKQGSYIYALYQRGLLEGLLGEPFEKIVTMRDLIIKYPQSEYADDALMELGDTYAEVENFENAYQSYSELVTQYKHSPYTNDAYLKLALNAYNKGDMNKAIEHYKAVMANNPSIKESESAFLGLREIYINDLGKSDEYVAYISKLPGYKISENTADSLAYVVGFNQYNEGSYTKAIAGFSNYIDKYPKGANRLYAQYYRGESYTFLKQYENALKDYEKVIEAGNSPFYVQSLRKSALIAYNAIQNFEKAFTYYDAYYRVLTDDEEKYQTAMGALRSAFRISNAEAIKKYGNLISSHAKATADDKAVAYYYTAKIYLRENDMNAAYDALEKSSVLVDNNQSAEARYLLAEILYKQGKIKAAEDQCNLANEANASYPYWIAKSLLLLSDIYVDKADLFNARAALEAIIENFQGDKELISEAQNRLDIVGKMEEQKSRIKPNIKESSVLELQKP